MQRNCHNIASSISLEHSILTSVCWPICQWYASQGPATADKISQASCIHKLPSIASAACKCYKCLVHMAVSLPNCLHRDVQLSVWEYTTALHPPSRSRFCGYCQPAAFPHQHITSHIVSVHDCIDCHCLYCCCMGLGVLLIRQYPPPVA